MKRRKSHRSDILVPMSKPHDAKTKNPAAVALGSLGGRKNTEAQRRARSQNASRFAGRPGRVCATCGEPVLGGHKNHALDATCPGHTWKWAPARREGRRKKGAA
jgi:hypothetical protein